MTGIIAAMKAKTDLLERILTDAETEFISGIEFKSGYIQGQKVVIAVCGVGKVFAAMCAQTMILKYSPDAIINTGVAGTLTDKLEIGSVCIADNVVQHDMDTSPIGDPVGMLSGINITYIPCSEKIFGEIKRIADRMEISNIVGTIASGDQFVASENIKKRIADNFSASACDMEGAAIGQVCYINSVPFAVIRAISDGANDGSPIDYPTFTKHAAEISAKIVETYIAES